MPQCVFKNCKNNYRKINVSDGISYFRFPSDPFQCAKWISVVVEERQEDFFKPKKNSVVCSLHFEHNDIITNSQRRRLRKKGVPNSQILPLAENATALGSENKPIISNSEIHAPSQRDVIKEVSEITPNLEVEPSATSEMIFFPSSPTVSVSDLSSVSETPREKLLSRKLEYARKIIKNKSNKIHNLKKVNQRLIKKNNSLKNIIKLHKKKIVAILLDLAC